MREWVLLGLLVAFALLGMLAQGRRDVNDQWARVGWMGVLGGLVLATQAPNPFVAGLIGMGCLGMVWHPPVSTGYRTKVAGGLWLVAVYVVGAGLVREWMVVPVLMAMAVAGAVIGGLALYAHGRAQRGESPERAASTLANGGVPVDEPYNEMRWGGWLWMVERDAKAPLVGQGNFNHAQSVGAMAAACSAALIVLGYGVAWPLFVLSLTAVALASEGRVTGQWVSQGTVHCGVLATVLALAATGWAWWALVAGAYGIVALLLWAKPWNPRKNWYDSGRFAMWRLALVDIWWTANQPRRPEHALTLIDQREGQLRGIQQQAMEAEAATQVPAEKQQHAAVHNQMTLALEQLAFEREVATVLQKAQTGEALTATEKPLRVRLLVNRWRVRLLGIGTGSWFPQTKIPCMLLNGTFDPATKQFKGMVFTSAHNEFVEVCFEQGLLGLALTLAWVGTSVAMLWSGGLVAQALLLPVAVLLSVACLNFPFTLFVEVERQRPEDPVQFMGSPALLTMSLVLLLLVEAVR